MRTILLVLVAVAGWGEFSFALAAERASQAPGSSETVTDRKAEAYRLFMLGRRFERTGEIDSAVDAYERAAKLDPEAADILSELAGLHLRQNRVDDAIEAGEAALRVDASNEEAHRILGLAFARLAEGRRSGGSRAEAAASAATYTARAIAHLEQAWDGQSLNPRVQLALARLYVSTRAHEKAIGVLSELIAQRAGSTETVLLLARAYAGAGRRADAISLLEQAIRQRPEFYRAQTQLAELYERELRWSDAAAMYERAIEQNPRSSRLRRRQATALVNAGEVVRARDVLRELVAARPTDRSGLYLLSDVERRLNDFDAAEATARRLIAAAPNEMRGPYALALVFSQRREHRKVVETLEPAIAAARGRGEPLPQIASLAARVGFAYRALEEYDRAIAVLEHAVEESPADVALQAQLAQAYLAARRFPDALELVRRARDGSPSSLSLARLEAQALSESGQLETAVGVLEDALRTHENEPLAYVALASLYGDVAQFEDALRVLEIGSSKFPDDTSILFQRGAVFERQAQYQEAEQAFRQVLARDPEHAQALNYLGYMLADRGEQLEESVGLLRRAIQIDPHNGAFLDSLGWAYFKLNQLELAESHLRQASDQLKTNSVVQDHLGDLMYELGRYRDAIAAWQRALAGDREDIELATIEQKIRTARDRVNRE